MGSPTLHASSWQWKWAWWIACNSCAAFGAQVWQHLRKEPWEHRPGQVQLLDRWADEYEYEYEW